jgi:hypothetical protein
MLCTIASTAALFFLRCPYAYKSSLDPLTQFSAAQIFTGSLIWSVGEPDDANEGTKQT